MTKYVLFVVYCLLVCFVCMLVFDWLTFPAMRGFFFSFFLMVSSGLIKCRASFFTVSFCSADPDSCPSLLVPSLALFVHVNLSKNFFLLMSLDLDLASKTKRSGLRKQEIKHGS